MNADLHNRLAEARNVCKQDGATYAKFRAVESRIDFCLTNGFDHEVPALIDRAEALADAWSDAVNA